MTDIHSYDEMLDIIFQAKQAVKVDKIDNFKFKLPNIVIQGPRRTLFTNFVEWCNHINRLPQSVCNFISSELSCVCYIAPENWLLIAGSFRQNQMESLLKKYIRQLVLCSQCCSPNTSIIKTNKFHVIKCHSCSSEKTIDSY